MAVKKQFNKKSSVEDDGAISMTDENVSTSEAIDETPVDEVVSTDDGENPETAPEVNFNDSDVGVPPAPKNVKVVLRIDHTCTIGGERYHFEKGKQYNVPFEVKSILKQAGLLMPL